MRRLVAKNWGQFQHYKDRSPPWIRLHRALLDNRDFQRLPVASRALAPMLWLLASESLDGSINADPDELAFRLRQPESEIIEALKPLIDKGFFSYMGEVASEPLAPRSQVAVPETETETEKRQKGVRKRPPSFDAASIDLPEWLDGELWREWVAERKAKGKPITERAAREQLSALSEYRSNGHTPDRVIRHAIASGNQGLYPPPRMPKTAPAQDHFAGAV